MKSNASSYFLLLFFLIYTSGVAQTTAEYPSKKGQLYFFWGWNRAYYSHSDIHFKGENYDFTLKNVVAKDRQTPIGADPYLQPGKITIPQTNFRIGYYLNDHYEISIGDDHMKYVVAQNQKVKIDGYISNTGTAYDGNYADQDINLYNDFLKYEHTDGLNYINIEIRRTDNFSHLFKIKPDAAIQLYSLAGIGTGVLFPRTNCTLLNNARNDEFHVAGYGFAPVAGLNITFFKRIFLQGELKGGFINLPDVRTTSSESDKAKQHFFFFQTNFSVGAAFPITKRK